MAKNKTDRALTVVVALMFVCLGMVVILLANALL